MSKEKQIEEMTVEFAKINCNLKGCYSCNLCDEYGSLELSCEDYLVYRKMAETFYNAGYRKQSEWISVEERLPDLETTRSDGYHRPKSVRVLCACKQRSGKVFVKEGYYEVFGKSVCWRIPGSIDSVTHWMPLPETPKGGAE